jgi:hypothetical protein
MVFPTFTDRAIGANTSSAYNVSARGDITV